MTESKGKERLTLYLSPNINQQIRHMAVDEKTTVSFIIEKLIKKAIEWEKVRKV